MREVHLFLVAIMAGCGLSACAGGPTLDQPRRLDAPVQAGKRLFDLFLSPAAVGRDTRRIVDRAGSLLRDEADLRAPVDQGIHLVGDEMHRLGALAPGAERLAGDEVARLGTLRHSPAWSAFAVGDDLGDLRRELLSLQHTLQLDRRAMEEPDDFRRRTDPDDDHPEASLGARLLRRILP